MCPREFENTKESCTCGRKLRGLKYEPLRRMCGLVCFSKNKTGLQTLNGTSTSRIWSLNHHDAERCVLWPSKNTFQDPNVRVRWGPKTLEVLADVCSGLVCSSKRELQHLDGTSISQNWSPKPSGIEFDVCSALQKLNSCVFMWEEVAVLNCEQNSHMCALVCSGLVWLRKSGSKFLCCLHLVAGL